MDISSVSSRRKWDERRNLANQRQGENDLLYKKIPPSFMQNISKLLQCFVNTNLFLERPYAILLQEKILGKKILGPLFFIVK